MPSRKKIEADIIDIVGKYTSRNRDIRPDTAIYHDLHIAGDDAYELLMEVWKRFALSKDTKFDFYKFFPDETEALFFYWKARLGFPDNKRLRLTVGHLVGVAERGCWFDPPKVD